MTGSILYASACVLVPALWGVVMYHVFGWIQRRTRRGGPKADVPPIDYSI